jgi:hypothetical protein
MRFRQQIWALAVATAISLWASAAFAQERHIVDRPALAAAVSTKGATQSADREAVLSVLHQPKAQSMAAEFGLKPSQVDDAVATMSASEVAALASPARLASTAQAGGDSITISLTALLLLAILLVLIIK